mgnify:CR=1 FL=1
MLNGILMNTVGPFVIWKSQKLPAIVGFEKIDDALFLRERSEEFVAYAESLESLGFELIGSSTLRDTESDTFFRLYCNPNSEVVASCVCGKNALGEVNYIEFSQKYSDGSILDVSNNPVPGVFPKLEIKDSYRYPAVSCVNELMDIFNKLKNGLKTSLTPRAYDVEGGFSDIEALMKQESDELVKKGFVTSNIDDQGKRSLTLYGAAFLTYRAVSPGKDIWGYITERSAKKTLSSV